MAQVQKDNRDQSANKEPQFGIQRIYIKDISFETPNSPKMFLEEWKPEMNLDLGTQVNNLDTDIHEVILTVTVTVKVGEAVAFLAEVKHAGIFSVEGFEDEKKHHMLGAYCPNILYPYAREVVSDLVTRGGFPQLYLTPVNFDALYAQHQEESQGADAADSDSTETGSDSDDSKGDAANEDSVH